MIAIDKQSCILLHESIVITIALNAVAHALAFAAALVLLLLAASFVMWDLSEFSDDRTPYALRLCLVLGFVLGGLKSAVMTLLD